MFPKVVIGGATDAGLETYIRCKEDEGFHVVSNPQSVRNTAWLKQHENRLELAGRVAEVVKGMKPGHIHYRGIYDLLVFEAINLVKCGWLIDDVERSLKMILENVEMPDVKYIVLLYDDNLLSSPYIPQGHREYIQLQNRFFKIAADVLGAYTVIYDGHVFNMYAPLNSIVTSLLPKLQALRRTRCIKRVCIGGHLDQIEFDYLESKNASESLNFEPFITADRFNGKMYVIAAVAKILEYMEGGPILNFCIYDYFVSEAVVCKNSGISLNRVKNTLRSICNKIRFDSNFQYVVVIPSIEYSQTYGHENAKDVLYEVVAWQLDYPCLDRGLSLEKFSEEADKIVDAHLSE